MGLKEILEFVKVEHTLFSLPFVLIGFVLADNQFGSERMDIVWIIIAAVGARGLAMALNRIIDREIDSSNPRTSSRHLPSGTMSTQTAWMLSAAFLGMLLFAAGMLNEVALKMAWLPVIAFVIYPLYEEILVDLSLLDRFLPGPCTSRCMGRYRSRHAWLGIHHWNA